MHGMRSRPNGVWKVLEVIESERRNARFEGDRLRVSVDLSGCAGAFRSARRSWVVEKMVFETSVIDKSVNERVRSTDRLLQRSVGRYKSSKGVVKVDVLLYLNSMLLQYVVFAEPCISETSRGRCFCCKLVIDLIRR